ncbi:6320_t:CDS:1, partial [Cetraspora pellucida]
MPYHTSLKAIDSYSCDFCVYGDDTTLCDETDCYQAAKDEVITAD